LDHRSLAGIAQEEKDRHEIPIASYCTICGDLGPDLLVFVVVIRFPIFDDRKQIKTLATRWVGTSIKTLATRRVGTSIKT
jgi:hypothetical protein